MNVPGGVQPRSWRHPLRWATLAMALAVVSWLVVAIPVVVLQYWVLPDVDRYAPEIERDRGLGDLALGGQLEIGGAIDGKIERRESAELR